jgi:hypothetical protein
MLLEKDVEANRKTAGRLLEQKAPAKRKDGIHDI